jgi:hypothetical protein
LKGATNVADNNEHSEIKLVGTVGVDAGCIWIGDPTKHEAAGVFLDEVEERTKGRAWLSAKLGEGWDSSVVVDTGLGDGIYSVYALVKDLGEAGKRVAAVVITFMSDEVTEQDVRDVFKSAMNESYPVDPDSVGLN